jgi:CO/xanthine dehydrogenase FAD-binding subunit
MNYLRKLPKFDYLAPQSIPQVCEMLAEYGAEAKLMAGGTDLIIMMRRREVVPRYVIGLKSVPELQIIRQEQDGSLTIGAMATSWSIQSSPAVRRRYDFLAQTAADIGSIENLHVSTIGGNLCDGLPCVDFPAPLLTLDAEVKLVSQRGGRIVPLDSFYLGYQKTAVEPDEVLTEIHIPPHNDHHGGAYIKFHDRHAIDITTTGAGALIALGSDGQTARDARIALTTSAPVPLRVKRAEAALCGRKVTEEAIEEAAKIASEEASPRTSWRSTAEFRTKLVEVLVRRALRQAWRKATTTPASGPATDLWLMHPLDPRIGGKR